MYVGLPSILAFGLYFHGIFAMVIISRSPKTCNDESLTKRESMANVIVTGFVDKVVREPRKSMFNCEIKVVRVLKGASEIHNGIIPKMAHDNKIMVGGFGDPDICGNVVHEGDTKLLMMNIIAGHLMINSSVVTVTFNNLEVADAAVHGITPITKAPTITAVCDRILCTFGSYCQETSTGNPKCVCPDACPGMSSPVCGTDRITYQSSCHMKVAACTARQLVSVLNEGECVDPCETMVCKRREVCESRGAVAVCVCPSGCDDGRQESGTVCGNDGRDYESECDLDNSGCRDRKNYTLIYYGSCDPYSGLEFEVPVLWKLNKNRQPVLRCAESCPMDYNPVCGSDGLLYRNPCHLERYNCVNDKDLVTVHDEGCSENGPCTGELCEFGSCRVTADMEAECVCPYKCEPIYTPVCANDGLTYNSRCELEKAACLNMLPLVVFQAGPCEKDLDICAAMECDYGARCTEENGFAECVCSIDCDGEMDDPVCGSDTNTYSSPCEVRRAMCLQKADIEITAMGDCDGCEEDTCSFGAYCRMTDQGPTCTCPEFCMQGYSPICGSDGETYTNQCYLNKAACQMQTDIEAISHGNCDQCLNVNCTFGAVCNKGRCRCKRDCPFIMDPVCGTNGITYENECKLNLTMCRVQVQIDVAVYDECDVISGSGSGMGSGDEDFDATTHLTMSEVPLAGCDETTCAFGGVCAPGDGGGLTCSCAMSCPAMRSPVCGSDEMTYGNLCQLLEASCEQQRSIMMESLGTCEDVEQEPCDGELPLSDSEGTMFTCTEANRGDECPSGSYCHVYSAGNHGACCAEDITTVEQSCEESTFGCCPDRETPAMGVDEEGCEEDRECECNMFGSYDTLCDVNGQCSCKPGVVGELCNSCSPGFWNFHGILIEGNEGCQPCSCNRGGSVRDDCGQDIGQCVCKEGVTGMKCDMCPAGLTMTAMGCIEDEDYVPTFCVDGSCEFGADCMDVDGTPVCLCPSECSGEHRPVCGSDGQTYSNDCQLRVIACRSERDIYIESTGPCETTIVTPTVPMETCETSMYGCCPDGETKATGSEFAGCDEISSTPSVYVDGTPEPENISLPVMACNSSPCKRGGTCMDDEEAPGFVCYCPLGTGGPVCLENVYFSQPSFSGDSYMAYETVKGLLSVSIKLEFKTEESDGLLFYNGENDDGTGDFISLSLVNGFVEFRFDLGLPDEVVIRSTVEIERNTWYRIVSTRSSKQGSLSVDEEQWVFGSSTGGSRLLHLGTEMFLGNVVEGKDKVFSRTGAARGFRGCIRYFEVNSEVYDLSYPQTTGGDILYGVNVGQCGRDPCSMHDCQNNATCVAVDAEMYTCDCREPFIGPYCGDVFADQCEGNMCHFGSTCVPEPFGSYRCDCSDGATGDRCEELAVPDVTGPFIPAFDGDSYMEYSSILLNGQQSITVEFLSRDPDGMIFYQGQKTDGNGDFISLNLVNGFLEYRFDLGSGPSEIRSSEPILLDEWIRVIVTRNVRDGTLEIEGLELIEGYSKGALSQLNLNLNLFIGGTDDYSKFSRKAAITDGLVGAVRKFAINDVEITDLMDAAVTKVNVVAHIPDVCLRHPCMPGFLCDGETGSCVCPEGLVLHDLECVSPETVMVTGMMAMTTSLYVEEEGTMTPGEHTDTKPVTPMVAYSTSMADDMTPSVGEMDLVTLVEEDTKPVSSGATMMPTPAMPAKTTEKDTIAPRSTTAASDDTDDAHTTSLSEIMTDAKDPSSRMATPGMATEGRDTVSTTKKMSVMKTTTGVKSTGKPMEVPRSTEEPINIVTSMKMTTPVEDDVMQTPSKDTMPPSSFPPPPPMTTTSPPPRRSTVPVTTTMPRMVSTKMPKTTQRITTIPPTTQRITTTNMPTTTQRITTTKMPTTTQRITTRTPTTKVIDLDAAVSFSGIESYSYNNMVTKTSRAQMTNEFVVNIKTFQENGLVLWNGPVDFVGLAVVNGYIMYAYQLGSGTMKMTSTVYVADGIFHRIHASRAVRDGTLQVDDEDPILAKSNPGASQLNTDGVIHIGGAPNVPARKLPRGFETYFDGCIGFVEVEETLLHLYHHALEEQPQDFCSP